MLRWAECGHVAFDLSQAQNAKSSQQQEGRALNSWHVRQMLGSWGQLQWILIGLDTVSKLGFAP
jgi:hypothetical protein